MPAVIPASEPESRIKDLTEKLILDSRFLGNDREGSRHDSLAAPMSGAGT